MSFATLGALASQISGYTIFNGGNQRALTLVGYYTGSPSENVGKNLNPASVIPLSFTGNKNGGNGSNPHTWSAVGIQQKMPMSKYDRIEVIFSSSRSGTLLLGYSTSAEEKPKIGGGFPIVRTVQEKTFSSGDNTLTFDIPAEDGYMFLQAQISNTATSLTFEIQKWRMMKDE